MADNVRWSNEIDKKEWRHLTSGEENEKEWPGT
jgi:hypothetical protein